MSVRELGIVQCWVVGPEAHAAQHPRGEDAAAGRSCEIRTRARVLPGLGQRPARLVAAGGVVERPGGVVVKSVRNAADDVHARVEPVLAEPTTPRPTWKHPDLAGTISNLARGRLEVMG